ncbi:DUF2478 domain-containing protein [Roseibium porphyridii]|uniref:DUF2478 domain-containing protein n=1 Tax=Roseibium porphyridii TaxID=2866279 RepID=A0ABY8F7H1_9HYPH|nr:DUF2478 domain-containing protein [Roseibium sp. KMA01]WFE88638.1 DUF2478 domain-containing protein [Roseibium sp. KMA01]
MVEDTPLCGAIRSNRGENVDRLLETLVKLLQAEGLCVSGVVQRRAEYGDTCCADMGLELISSGETIEISQALGRGSQGCRLDPRSLADITARLQTEIDLRPDLLVLNRFGKGEQDGQGFRQLIGKAMELSIPVLTVVREPYLEAWRNFAGELAVDLPADLDATVAWCLTVSGKPAAVAANG